VKIGSILLGEYERDRNLWLIILIVPCTEQLFRYPHLIWR